jgi:hypothetical protein
MPVVTVDYGYDVHSIEIDEDTYRRLLKGECVDAEGQGFLYDEYGWQKDHWVIDGKTGEATFYLDDAAEFNGKIIRME